MNKIYTLKDFGWNEFFEAHFSEHSGNGLEPARVAVEHRNYYELYSAHGELTAEKSGKLFYSAESTNLLPAVGDWVVIKPILDENKALITVVLPRKTKFSRKKAGETTDEQIVAANVDTVFVISSLNQDLNYRRIERYLALSWDNDVKPVVILSKADLSEDIFGKLAAAQNALPATDIHIISAKTGAGMEELFQYFEGNKTVAVIGSLGVGKSTLINSLLDRDIMDVSEIGLYKDKGRHTTTHRELTIVPGGGLIMDTPGMREIQLWEGGEGLSELFEDIEKLVLECKFTNCKHESEPGCAINAAIKKGELDAGRLKSYKKLLGEVSYFERKKDIRLQIAEKKKWKKLIAEGKKRDKRNI